MSAKIYDSKNVILAFVFGSRNRHIWALSQLSLCTHNSDCSLYNYFSIFVQFVSPNGRVPVHDPKITGSFWVTFSVLVCWCNLGLCSLYLTTLIRECKRLTLQHVQINRGHAVDRESERVAVTVRRPTDGCQHGGCTGASPGDRI